MNKIETVKDLYDAYKRYYEETGRKEHPAMLLALFLFSKGYNFDRMIGYVEGKFYKKHKEIIDEAIQQVENDFHFTIDEYAKIVLKSFNDFDESNYEQEKIWSCYAEGFGCVHWGLMYHNDENIEDIYSQYFDGRDAILLKTDVKHEKIFGHTYEGFCENIRTYDYLSDTNDFVKPTIKITLTNVELDTLKECGNLIVLRQKDAPIEITLAEKEETPKQIVKNQKN